MEESVKSVKRGNTVEEVTSPATKKPKVKLVKVIVPREVGKKVQEDVPITINGKTILIQRGVEVEIPENYASVLRQSAEAKDIADAFYFGNSK